jgi:hypothetical protein
MLLALTLAIAAVGAGCATAEGDNLSARPWNAPQGWETGGLPSTMMEGR